MKPCVFLEPDAVVAKPFCKRVFKRNAVSTFKIRLGNYSPKLDTLLFVVFTNRYIKSFVHQLKAVKRHFRLFSATVMAL